MIVTADDFGESPAVNEAVLQAQRGGILTGASLMVTGAAFAHAVEQARANPDLYVGLHVVLLNGRSCLPPAAIPALVDRAGRFPESPLTAGIRWAFDGAARGQLRREIRAQVERFIETGLPLDHLNAHHHFHIHPLIYRILREAAAENGVRHIRFPEEPWRLSWRIDRRGLPHKAFHTVAFGLLTRYHRARLPAAACRIDGVFGLLQSGRIDEAYLCRLAGRLPHGTYELYTHPRLDSEAGRRELAALQSPRVRQALDARGIRLTAYSQLS